MKEQRKISRRASSNLEYRYTNGESTADVYDRMSSFFDTMPTDSQNARFDFMTYSKINDVGKQWIRKYGLALAKELLGIIRSKYGSIPIPNSDTTLDGDTLRSEAATEKEVLVTQLREMLEQTSRKALLEADKDEAEFLQEKLQKIPYPIYIG